MYKVFIPPICKTHSPSRGYMWHADITNNTAGKQLIRLYRYTLLEELCLPQMLLQDVYIIFIHVIYTTKVDLVLYWHGNLVIANVQNIHNVPMYSNSCLTLLDLPNFITYMSHKAETALRWWLHDALLLYSTVHLILPGKRRQTGTIEQMVPISVSSESFNCHYFYNPNKQQFRLVPV